MSRIYFRLKLIDFGITTCAPLVTTAFLYRIFLGIKMAFCGIEEVQHVTNRSGQFIYLVGVGYVENISLKSLR